MPCASTILMIRPAAFGFNEETAVNNFFQNNLSLTGEKLQQKALAEFENMVRILNEHEINVIVIDDTKLPVKPDALFPNNWISTSPEGIISIFPMYAPSRRTEKRDDILQTLSENFVVNDV